MMKLKDQQDLARRLKASIKEYLYCNSPLRLDFQVRPLDEGELKIFENVKYARVIDETALKSGEIKNKNVYVPLFEIGCNQEDKNFEDKFKSFNEIICDGMLSEEKKIFKMLKKYYTKNRKGVLLIRTDLQVLCSNDEKTDTMGFSSFEDIGAVILNK